VNERHWEVFQDMARTLECQSIGQLHQLHAEVTIHYHTRNVLRSLFGSGPCYVMLYAVRNSMVFRWGSSEPGHSIHDFS